MHCAPRYRPGPRRSPWVLFTAGSFQCNSTPLASPLPWSARDVGAVVSPSQSLPASLLVRPPAPVSSYRFLDLDHLLSLPAANSELHRPALRARGVKSPAFSLFLRTERYTWVLFSYVVCCSARPRLASPRLAISIFIVGVLGCLPTACLSGLLRPLLSNPGRALDRAPSAYLPPLETFFPVSPQSVPYSILVLIDILSLLQYIVALLASGSPSITPHGCLPLCSSLPHQHLFFPLSLRSRLHSSAFSPPFLHPSATFGSPSLPSSHHLPGRQRLAIDPRTSSFFL